MIFKDKETIEKEEKEFHEAMDRLRKYVNKQQKKKEKEKNA